MALDESALASLPRKELHKLLKEGRPLTLASLVPLDTVGPLHYNGVSLGLGRLIERLTWSRFRKSFHRDPQTGKLFGWNVRIDNRQEGYQPLLSRRGEEIHFGFFEAVFRPCPPNPPNPTVLLDYSKGPKQPKARLPSLLSLVRDPLVCLTESEPSQGGLILGWSYLDLGFCVLGTPSFFTLRLVQGEK